MRDTRAARPASQAAVRSAAPTHRAMAGGHRRDHGKDGQRPSHDRAAGALSLAVIASGIVVTVGLQIADPLIGLAITLVILRITWESWRTVRAGHAHHHHH
jgi:divalent metal cation (Fe/Co/Zn/Cd) transporter